MNAISTKLNFRVLPAMLASLILCGCGGGGTFSPTVNGTTPEVVSILIVPPKSDTTNPGGTLQFSAVVSGTSDKRVNWSAQIIEEDTIRDPLISSTGLFSSEEIGNYTITAQSVADPTKTATASASVVEGNTGLTGTINARPKTR